LTRLLFCVDLLLASTHCLLLLQPCCFHPNLLLLLLLLSLLLYPAGKPFSVLGFGSSNYPKFAAAADLLHSSLLAAGAAALLPPAKADALVGEEGVVWPWMKQLTAELQQQGMLDSAAAQALEGQVPTAEANAVSSDCAVTVCSSFVLEV
jgi:hypothetical protein